MKRRVVPLLVGFLLVVISLLSGSFQSFIQVQAEDDYRPMTPNQIRTEMKLFFEEKNAVGYLLWQYSGDRMDPLGNDQHSFFYNLGPEPEICKTLQEMAKTYPDKFVGVNMFNVGSKGTEYAARHFKHLHDDCGVTVIRTFPSESGGVPAVQAVRDAAEQAQVKIIYAIANPYYGTGGIPTFEAMVADQWKFYKGGYKGEYKTFALSVLEAAKAKPETLYGVELANEPHCMDGAGDSTVFDAYKNWAHTMAGVLSSAGRVGIGQMASDANSKCDSPSLGTPGQTPYAMSNSSANITMASAHYYTDTAKEQALLAADEAHKVGKDFYIGEAGWGGEIDNSKKSNYYLYPIQGLLSGDNNSFRQDLINQGYQAFCTTPKINILGNVAGLDKLDQATLNSLSGQIMKVNSEQKYDYSTATIPILRDKSDSASLFSSIEDYWGFKNITEQDPISQQIASSPVYSLLTLEDQCVRQKRMLEVVEKMCLKLTDPTTCALDKKIPGTDYTVLSLNTLVKAHPSLTCKRIAEGNTLNQEEVAVAKAVRNVPLYLDKAYRLGFLVVAAELKTPTTGISFNFLKWDTKEADYVPKHDVRVIAFKLPDTTTNKNPNSDIYYEEPLITTRNAILSKTDIDRLQADAANKKQQARINTQQDLIECGNDDLCKPNTLSRELVNFVNNRIEHLETCDANPQDLPFEPVNSIQDKADLPAGKETDQTVPPEQGNVVEQLNLQKLGQKIAGTSNTTETNKLDAFKFLSLKKLGNADQTSFNTKISSYLIIPQGYELAAAEKTLAGLIFTDQEIQQMENTSVYSPEFEYKQYFKLADTGQEFPEAKATLDVGLNRNCLNQLKATLGRDPTEEEEKQCYNRIEASVRSITDKGETDSKEKDREPRIFGGRLGFLMRKIQQSLFNRNTPGFNFVKTCTTTEEFLQGSCDGGNVADQGVQQPINRLGKCFEDCMAKDGAVEQTCRDTCKEVAGSCIQVWVETDTANEYATTIKNNLPGQRTATLHFAGWEAYFRGVNGIPYLFEPACNGNNLCYQYILDQVLAAPRSDGLVVNPYLAIAISLNETGGLRSTDTTPGHRGSHFGCGINVDNPAETSQDTIENKLRCMIGYFQDNQSLNSFDSLKRYGYANGNQNSHLSFIIDVVSNYTYNGQCD